MARAGKVPLAITFPGRADDTPVRGGASESGCGPKCATSTSEVKVCVAGVDAVLEARRVGRWCCSTDETQWDRRSPWLPEGVQHTDQCAPLAEIVVQVEHLEAAVAGRTQTGLNLFLVAGNLEPAGSVRNLLVLRQQAMLLRGVAHDLVVAGNHVRDFHMFRRAREGGIRAAELLDDVEVGIGAPLANLVADGGESQRRAASSAACSRSPRRTSPADRVPPA